MSLTVTINKLGTTAIADVDMLGLDQTKLELVASDKTETVATAEYILADGSLDYDLKVFVRSAFDARANSGRGISRYQIRVVADLTVEDSVLGQIANDPVECGIFLNWPGKGISDITEARQMLNNMYALTFPSVAAGVINDSFLTALAYGLTQLY